MTELALEPPARQTLRVCLRFAMMALSAGVFRLPSEVGRSAQGRNLLVFLDKAFRELEGEIDHAAIVALMAALDAALKPLDRAGFGAFEIYARATRPSDPREGDPFEIQRGVVRLPINLSHAMREAAIRGEDRRTQSARARAAIAWLLVALTGVDELAGRNPPKRQAEALCKSRETFIKALQFFNQAVSGGGFRSAAEPLTWGKIATALEELDRAGIEMFELQDARDVAIVADDRLTKRRATGWRAASRAKRLPE